MTFLRSTETLFGPQGQKLTLNVPVSFSADCSKRAPYNANPPPPSPGVYAKYAAQIVDQLVRARNETLLLPRGIWLNVNFPDVNKCRHPWKTVLTRIYPGTFSDADMVICGDNRLPQEWQAVNNCHIALTVGDASDKKTADARSQAIVAEKFGGMLSCCADCYLIE